MDNDAVRTCAYRTLVHMWIEGKALNEFVKRVLAAVQGP